MISLLVTASCDSLLISLSFVILSCCSISLRSLIISFSFRRFLLLRLKTRLRIFFHFSGLPPSCCRACTDNCFRYSTTVWLLWRYNSWFQITMFSSMSLLMVSVCCSTKESFRHSERNLLTFSSIFEIMV